MDVTLLRWPNIPEREKRLTKTQQYQDVRRRGKSWSNSYIVVQAVPSGLSYSRFGFTVGKRVGIAVQRNLVKRRLREIVKAIPIKSGWDVVLIARRPAADCEFQQLAEAVRDVLTRGRLLVVAD